MSSLLPSPCRPVRPLFLVCLLWTLAWGSASAADPQPGQIEVREGEPASLIFWNREVAILRAEIAGVSPTERVRRIRGKIDDVLKILPGDAAVAIPGTLANLSGYWVEIDGQPVFGLVPQDADGMTGQTLDELVRQTVSTLQGALDARREQRSLPLILEGVGLATAATLLLGALLWGVARLHVRAMRRQHLLAPVPIKVGGLDLHPILRALEGTAIKATSFGLAAIAIYLWLTFIFGRFPFTRPWGEGLAGFLADLLATFAAGALHALPGLFTVLVIFVLTRVIVRMVDGLYRTVERGALSVSWLHADTAKATRRLAVVLIWVFAMTVAYPLGVRSMQCWRLPPSAPPGCARIRRHSSCSVHSRISIRSTS